MLEAVTTERTLCTDPVSKEEGELPCTGAGEASRRHTSRKKRKGMRKRRTDRGRGATGSPGSVRGAPRTGAPQGRGGLGRKREQWKEG